MAENIYVYTLGISLGIMLGRYLYIWAKRERFVKTSNKIVAAIVNTAIITVGFVVGFITVVFMYVVLHILFNDGKI